MPSSSHKPIGGARLCRDRTRFALHSCGAETKVSFYSRYEYNRNATAATTPQSLWVYGQIIHNIITEFVRLCGVCVCFVGTRQINGRHPKSIRIVDELRCARRETSTVGVVYKLLKFHHSSLADFTAADTRDWIGQFCSLPPDGIQLPVYGNDHMLTSSRAAPSGTQITYRRRGVGTCTTTKIWISNSHRGYCKLAIFWRKPNQLDRKLILGIFPPN